MAHPSGHNPPIENHVTFPFDKHLRAEFGYLNQYLQNTDHTQGTMHHLMMGSLFITF